MKIEFDLGNNRGMAADSVYGMLVFLLIWETLTLQHDVDPMGGAQFNRCFSEWQKAGRPCRPLNVLKIIWAFMEPADA